MMSGAVMARGIITLTTDFGYGDPYVGIMKGVIASINPEARIVDLSHDVKPYSVRHAAYLLLASYKWFPKGTIHVVVVDPGVGTERRSLVVETENYFFVGPDNGSLYWACMEDGVRRIIDASRSNFRLPVVSHTFHGRDVFAPLAAWLSLGMPAERLGVEVSDMMSLDPPRCVVRGDVVETEVLTVDRFGNLILGCRNAIFRPGDRVTVSFDKGVLQAPYVLRFADVPRGTLLLHTNSLGFLEVSVNMGNASVTTGLREGDRVWLRRS